MTDTMQRTYTQARASMLSLRDESKMYESLPGEEWILEAQARLSVKILGFPAGGAPGFISVTNKRIVFEPAKTSVTGATAEIPIQDIVKIKGARSETITSLLGYEYGTEVIHRNNMVLI